MSTPSEPRPMPDSIAAFEAMLARGQDGEITVFGRRVEKPLAAR